MRCFAGLGIGLGLLNYLRFLEIVPLDMQASYVFVLAFIFITLPTTLIFKFFKKSNLSQMLILVIFLALGFSASSMYGFHTSLKILKQYESKN